MNYFDFEGARVAYEDLGSGNPVILVHGAVVADPWGKFKPLLARQCRVIAIHLPGFGDSEAVHGKVHDTDLFARALCTLVNQLNLNAAPVIALSLGTVVAVKAAEKGCIRGQLMLAGMPTQTKGLMVKLSHFLPRVILRQLVRVNWIREKILLASLRVNVGRHREEIKWSREFAAKINKTSPEAIADVDYVTAVRQLPGNLDRITNDIRFVYGEYDPQKLGAGAWGLKYTIIKKSGHDVFSDQPQTMFKFVDSRLWPDIP
jgi:pimeloyl-ACP methyl ester carboxylesterase